MKHVRLPSSGNIIDADEVVMIIKQGIKDRAIVMRGLPVITVDSEDADALAEHLGVTILAIPPRIAT
jgi:hypothetical protein